MIDEDMVDHIAKVLKILDLINIPGMDTHRLRMKVFPLSLADDARQWWINEGEGKIPLGKNFWNKRRMIDNILSSKNTTTDSFLKPYMKTREKNDIEKEDERSQSKRKCNNSNLEDDILNNTSDSNNEQPNKKVCKAEKFEAIKYSLGPNEEYTAVRRCEYNTWERNKDRLRCKEIDDVGEVSIIWNPMCDCSN
ncbi:hypothetical protein Tco_1511271, partial [Tanacetum coccineum]